MLKLKKVVLAIFVAAAVLLTYLMLLICITYNAMDNIELQINGTGIEFTGITYSDLKQFELQSNSVFIVTDGEEQVDITTCDCEDSDEIKSITAVVSNTKSVCDFSVYGISVGDTSEVVIDNMPSGTSFNEDVNTKVMIAKYVDKDWNVLIVGTDMELDIVSYITVRTGN